jgi:hypothetical protein
VPKCLTIAFRPGIIITDVVQQFTREHPAAPWEQVLDPC